MAVVPSTTLGADALTATTNTGRDPWQEQLSRLSAVPAAKVLQAAEVIRGFAGSWAATYQIDPGTLNDQGAQDPRSPAPEQLKASRIGQMGFPEINFAPFAARTNRIGNKGGSLIGCPISFSVVGPTAKNQLNYWQWDVTDNSAVPGVGDELTLTHQTGGLSIAMLYGIPTPIEVAYPGGLYVLISHTGSAGEVYTDDVGTTAAGGSGDGVLVNVGGGELPLIPLDATSKYEIFRVVSKTAFTLTLDYSKRLASYFSIPAAPASVRSITLITPAATRLVAVPCGEAKGSETVFAVVPPRRVSNHDEQYPYYQWALAPHWHEDYPPGPELGVGTDFEYRQKPLSPLPKPKGYFNGRVYGEVGGGGAAANLPAGRWFFSKRNTDAGQTAPVIGNLVHIHGVRVHGEAALKDISGFTPDLSTLMGWFEVVDVIGTLTYVRRLEEANPLTGRTYVGSSNSFLMYAGWATGDRIDLDMTVHDPIETLWRTTYADIDKIDSARLTNLIDPRWVERSAKSPSMMPGLMPGRADRAVFDTSSGGAAGQHANPGSLLDLGFRMVLYPATTADIENPAGGVNSYVVPDWNHPIDTNDVILDTALKGEKQFVEVDYANGLVRLSHPIGRGSQLDPDVSIWTSVDNPRKEMVLFACCVPYSLEDGQTGVGMRVSGGSAQLDQTAFCDGTAESSEFCDTYGERIMFPLLNQTITSRSVPSGSFIKISGDVTGQIPPQGHVELLWGADGRGGPLFQQGQYSRGAVFGYDGWTISGGNTWLYNPHGGGVAATSATVDAAHPAVAVWRREVVTPNDLYGVTGVQYQFDTTYGSAKRSKVLRVSDATVRPNVDGSVTVVPRNTLLLSQTQLMSDLFSSQVISGGVVGTPAAPVLGICATAYTEAVVILNGRRFVVPAGTLNLPENTLCYVFIRYDNTASDCTLVSSVTTLPLQFENDILLALVDTNPALTTTDLRQLLQDVDRRVDLIVGKSPWAGFQPNFETLRAAVDYANEMMTPTAGTIGRNFRILVTDHTDEVMTSGPITIRTNGLVIEGAPRFDSTAAPAVYPEIRWTDNFTALIDLNGSNGLVFRNLSFRTDDIVAGALSNFVFLANLPSTDIIIDNCKVINFTAGLVAGVPAVAGVPHKRWQITRNMAKVTTAGVLFTDADGVLDPANPFEDLLIEDNTFTGVTTTSYAILLGSTTGFFKDYSVGSNVTVSRNRLTTHKYGIWCGARQLVISGNYVASIDSAGIRANGLNLRIEDNVLYSVCEGLVSPKGIHVEQGVDDTGYQVIRHNQVGLPIAADPDTDYSIWISGSGFQVKENQAIHVPVGMIPEYGFVYLDTDQSSVVGNNCGHLVVWGGGNTVQSNSTLDLHINWNPITVTALGSTTSNDVINNYSQNANLDQYTYAATNNFVGHSAGGGVVINSECRLENNRIGLLKDWTHMPGVWPAPSGLTLIGNAIRDVGQEQTIATGFATILAGCVAGDVLLIKGVSFTAVGGGAVAANQEFNDVASAGTTTASATSLCSAINHINAKNLMIAAAPVGSYCTGSNGGITNVVTLTASTIGEIGDLTLALNPPAVGHITLSGPTMTHSALAIDGLFRGSNMEFVGNCFECDSTTVLTLGRNFAEALQYVNFSHNRLGTSKDLTVYCNGCVIEGNKVDDLVLQGDKCNVATNYLTTITVGDVAGTSGSDVTITGNQVSGDIVVNTPDSAVSGNRVGSDILVQDPVAANCTVAGNIVTHDITADTSGSTVTGNWCRNVILGVNSQLCAVSANRTSEDIHVNSQNNTVTGNQVGDSIHVALAGTNSTVTGNRVAGDIAVITDAGKNPKGLIIMANNITGAITESSGNIPVAIVLGNHVTTVWGGAPDLGALGVAVDNSTLS
jgi:hypothetical protein